MRKLYFDIDGTLLIGDTGEPKATLADGAFESAVRESSVDHMVCVGSFVDAGRAALEIDASYDIHDAIFKLCGGVISDDAWFRLNTSFVHDSYSRATEIDLDEDWWFVDDMAEYFFEVAGLKDIFHQNNGGRILVPSPNGDGADVLNWIRGMP